jgi:acyl-CoA dehydrogenase
MRDTILYDSAFRLFGDHVSAKLLEAAEAGTWPAELWDMVERTGYLDVLAEGPAGMVEAATILRAAGHHAAPIPLAETMLAHWLCAAAGLEPPAGPLTMAPVEPEDEAGSIPWGRDAAAVVLVLEGRIEVGRGRFAPGANLAAEPRDRLIGFAAAMSAALPDTIGRDRVLGLGALMRAAQMAGAMEAALELSVRYANDRVQFGRPIGKFQAIQQQLAVLAEEAAATLVAVESASIAIAEARGSAGFAVAAAKLRAGEAAGRVAEIAHQVHGAIGFTEEHSLHYLTRRLWSWRDEFGDESWWALALGRRVAASGADGLWPMITMP